MSERYGNQMWLHIKEMLINNFGALKFQSLNETQNLEQLVNISELL